MVTLGLAPSSEEVAAVVQRAVSPSLTECSFIFTAASEIGVLSTGAVPGVVSLGMESWDPLAAAASRFISSLSASSSLLIANQFAVASSCPSSCCSANGVGGFDATRRFLSAVGAVDAQRSTSLPLSSSARLTTFPPDISEVDVDPSVSVDLPAPDIPRSSNKGLSRAFTSPLVEKGRPCGTTPPEKAP